MKKLTIVSIFLIHILTFSTVLFASNELSVLTDDYGSTKPGYIDKAILVVEPHGGYFEQSLYLRYSDHNQFPGSNEIEVVHRFELPKGTVVNDMWLWIADSMVQATMYDTWTATAIYDSIVTNKRDPALLKKQGTQFELHVYPLESGNYREVKINMVTPVRWFGQLAVAELPFLMLDANNSTTKPVEVLFRQKQSTWGLPEIYELPNLDFSEVYDSAGYQYRSLSIEDIGQLTSLKLSFDTNFNNGKFFSSFQQQPNTSYFQLGVLPGEFFNLEPDTSLKKSFYAIDLSGNKNKNLDIFLPNLKDILNIGMQEGDQYELIIAGAGKIKDISSGMQFYNPSSIEEMIDSFAVSTFADSIQIQKKPNILFADHYARDSWDFEEINEYADVVYFNNIMDALPSFSKADVITAYSHGYDDPISQEEFYQILTPLDSLFSRGGTLVTYFDYNRNENEKIASHYINGIHSTGLTANAQTLFRNDEGNIGLRFPDKLDHNFVGTLTYDDPDVVMELVTSEGKPAIISKQVKNGLLIVVDIWQVKDDGAMKSIMSPPLLGLNDFSKNLLLNEVLSYIKSKHELNSFDRCILMSNSDSLYTQQSTIPFVTNYFNSFSSVPKFNTINLLNSDNINPPSIKVDNKLYYGSGYLLYELSTQTGGIHFETYQDDWDYIKALSNYALNPLLTELEIDVQVDDGTADLEQIREVNPVRNDPNKPLYFIAKTNGQHKVDINFTANFDGVEDPIEKELQFLFSQDSSNYEFLIPSLLANEELKDLFNTSSYDTSQIVDMSIEYNLLTDYTALLVLEPNDSTIYLPPDGGDGEDPPPTDVQDENDKIVDSLSVEVYPNPFNSLVNINLAVSNNSNVSVSIYNILGQKIIDLTNNKNITGSLNLVWNGRNSYGSSISSGFYILRVDILDNATNKHDVISKKLVYLK